MLHNGRLVVLATLVALMFGLSLRAQQEQSGNDRRTEPRNTAVSARPLEPSDLAKENLGRVAASSTQLQGVLVIALDHSDERPPICDVLFDRFPNMRILALAAERDSSIFYGATYGATLDIRSNRI